MEGFTFNPMNDGESEDDLLLRLASHWNANSGGGNAGGGGPSLSVEQLLPQELPGTLSDLAAVWDRLTAVTSRVMKSNKPLPVSAVFLQAQRESSVAR
jgi:hypothetical protein